MPACAWPVSPTYGDVWERGDDWKSGYSSPDVIWGKRGQVGYGESAGGSRRKHSTQGCPSTPMSTAGNMTVQKQCTQCGRLFARTEHLVRHQRTRTYIPPSDSRLQRGSWHRRHQGQAVPVLSLFLDLLAGRCSDQTRAQSSPAGPRCRPCGVASSQSTLGWQQARKSRMRRLP